MTDSGTQTEDPTAMADDRTLDDEQLEHAVLMEIIDLHPARPTLDELHLALSYSRGEIRRFAIEDSLWSLRRFGLIREHGDVLEPTLTALRAAEVIQRA